MVDVEIIYPTTERPAELVGFSNGHGNGAALQHPRSRKALLRGLPHRMAALENTVAQNTACIEAHQQHLAAHGEYLNILDKQGDVLEVTIAGVEVQSGQKVDILADWLVEIEARIGRLADRLGVVDRRSARSRRGLAALLAALSE